MTPQRKRKRPLLDDDRHDDSVWFSLRLMWGELRVHTRLVGRKLRSATIWLILALALLASTLIYTYLASGGELTW